MTVTVTTDPNDLTADFLSMIQDLYSRVGDLESEIGGVAANGGPAFPGGIIIGSGGGAVSVSTSISQVGSISYTPGTYLTSGYVDVAWTEPDTTIDTVEVFYALKNLTGGTYQNASSTLPTGGTGVRVGYLIPGRTYGFYLVARNNIGIAATPQPAPSGGSPTYTDVAVPLDGTVPNTPSSLGYSLGADSLVLTWALATDLDVLNGGYYEAQIATNSGFTTGVQDWRGTATVMAFSALAAVSNAATSFWARVREISLSGQPGSWANFNSGSSLLAGGINGGDILAATVTAASIVAGTITATQIAANTITAGKIASGTITATQLSALQLITGQYIRSSNYVAATTGWNIDQGGTAEFNNVTVRGTVAASSITGSTIVGSTFETGTSGARVVINTSPWLGGFSPAIEFYAGATSIYDTPPVMTSYVDLNNCTALYMFGTLGPNNDAGEIIIDSTGVSIEAGFAPQIILLDCHHIELAGVIVDVGAFTVQSGVMTNIHAFLMEAVGSSNPTYPGDAFGITWAEITPTPLGTVPGMTITDASSSFRPVFAYNFYSSSDAKLKQDVKDLVDVSPLHKLRPRTFRWKSNPVGDQMGFVAQEVQEAIPTIVHSVVTPATPEGKHKEATEAVDFGLVMDYQSIIPLLVAEVQNLRKEIDSLQGAH